MSAKLTVWVVGLVILAVSLGVGHLIGAELNNGIGWGTASAFFTLIILVVFLIWFVFFRGDGPRISG